MYASESFAVYPTVLLIYLALISHCFADHESSSANDELVLSCLVHAATLYGQSVLTLQYIPHISYSVSLDGVIVTMLGVTIYRGAKPVSLTTEHIVIAICKQLAEDPEFK